MRTLLDTNVLLRYVHVRDPQNPAVIAKVEALLAEGDVLCAATQSLYELWVVATRPVDVNGLGEPPAYVRRMIETLCAAFPVLPEKPAVAAEWLDLCSQHLVLGRNAHDARLVALMRVYDIPRLLTLNPVDFARYREIECIGL